MLLHRLEEVNDLKSEEQYHIPVMDDLLVKWSLLLSNDESLVGLLFRFVSIQMIWRRQFLGPPMALQVLGHALWVDQKTIDFLRSHIYIFSLHLQICCGLFDVFFLFYSLTWNEHLRVAVGDFALAPSLIILSKCTINSALVSCLRHINSDIGCVGLAHSQLTSFCIWFVCGCGQLTALLTTLLMKDSFSYMRRFKTMKKATVSRCMLVLPCFDRSFDIKIDASDMGID